MSKYVHKCQMCGEEFVNDYKDAKFCSRQCYENFRQENRKLKNRQCPICGKDFQPSYFGQIFCGVKCRVISTENKVECTCGYCGKIFQRIKSEVDKNKHHYCSEDCKKKAMWWSEEDTEILRENYGKISYNQMVNLFSNPKSVDEIRRRAIYIGLTSSRNWSEDEKKILIDNYPNKPFNEILTLLPNRTESSIRGQAKTLNLKSFYYLSRKYTQEEEDYLRSNYLLKTNRELAEYLNRNENGIAQHLLILKLYRPHERRGYNDLAEYIRGRLLPWTKQIKRDNNFTCALTGKKSNIIIHHIRGFNLILNEAIAEINFPIYENVSDYSGDQLNQIFDTFYHLQETYKNYICLNESVHKQFHSIYGYGNNTKEQWEEFVNTYYKN